MSIEVQQISKKYQEQLALDNVSFTINAGEVVGFLGPNGAGKSTMMKIITTYIPPTNGNVKVCGFEVQENSIEVRKRVGYLPEHNPLYLDMYVKEYLDFVAHIYKLPNRSKRVAEMVDMVGLGVEQNKKIGALSKGYRQRIGLAQALIHDPEVLILDEPTSGLDPNQIVDIRELIKEVGKEKTVMLSTHIMQEVEAICNRVMIIKKGEIIADNNVANIVKGNDITQVLTVELSGKIQANKLLAIENIETVKLVGENIWLIAYTSETDVRKFIFDVAVAENLAVLTMQKQEKSLEEAFKELTNR